MLEISITYIFVVLTEEGTDGAYSHQYRSYLETTQKKNMISSC